MEQRLRAVGGPMRPTMCPLQAQASRVERGSSGAGDLDAWASRARQSACGLGIARVVLLYYRSGYPAFIHGRGHLRGRHPRLRQARMKASAAAVSSRLWVQQCRRWRQTSGRPLGTVSPVVEGGEAIGGWCRLDGEVDGAWPASRAIRCGRGSRPADPDAGAGVIDAHRCVLSSCLGRINTLIQFTVSNQPTNIAPVTCRHTSHVSRQRGLNAGGSGPFLRECQ